MLLNVLNVCTEHLDMTFEIILNMFLDIGEQIKQRQRNHKLFKFLMYDKFSKYHLFACNRIEADTKSIFVF